MSSEFLIGNRESGGGLKIQCFYGFWIVERKKDGKFQVGSADFGGVLAGQSPCVVERSGFFERWGRGDSLVLPGNFICAF